MSTLPLDSRQAGIARLLLAGTKVGSLSVVLGVIGVLAAIVLLIDPLSLITVVGFFVLIGFHLGLGGKVYRLSTARAES